MGIFGEVADNGVSGYKPVVGAPRKLMVSINAKFSISPDYQKDSALPMPIHFGHPSNLNISRAKE